MRLPFKVGTEIYTIDSGFIRMRIVRGFEYHYTIGVVMIAEGYRQIKFSDHSIGESVFFSYQKAEKALEGEENE